jgi:hypothetical protein
VSGSHWGKVLAIAAGAVIAAAITYGVVRLVAITLDAVVAWFRSRSALLAAGRNRLAVTVAESLAEGNVVIYRGIFDQHKNSFDELEKVFGETVDPQLADAHRRYGQTVSWTL